MSLTIKTYKVDGYDNEIDKELTTPISTLTGTFRDDFNVINPSFVLDDSEAIMYNLSFNYIKVETINRYYFVTDYTRLQTGLIALDLQEDVLKTFETALASTQVIFNRCTNYYTRDDIDDPMAIKTLGKTWDYIIPMSSPVSTSLRETYIDFGEGILDDTAIKSLPDTLDDLRIVVKMASKNYLNPDETTHTSVRANPKTTTNTLLMTPRALAVLLKEVWQSTFTNPEKAIGSVVVMPFAPSLGDTEAERTAYINNNRIYQMDLTIWSSNTVTFTDNGEWNGLCVRVNMEKLRGEANWYYNIGTSAFGTDTKYINSGKYRQWYWSCQPFGVQNINPDDLFGYTYLKLGCEYDFEANVAQLYYRGTNTPTTPDSGTPKIYLQTCQLGRETQIIANVEFGKQTMQALGSIAGIASAAVSLGTSVAITAGKTATALKASKAVRQNIKTARQISRNISKNVKNGTALPGGHTEARLAALNNAVGELKEASDASGNIIETIGQGAVGGALNMQLLTNSINNTFANMQPSIRCIGQSPNASFVTTGSPRLYQIKQTVYTYDANEIGKPSAKPGIISNIAGFLQVAYIYWETFHPTIPITTTEKELLQNILTDGAFYNRPHSG